MVKPNELGGDFDHWDRDRNGVIDILEVRCKNFFGGYLTVLFLHGRFIFMNRDRATRLTSSFVRARLSSQERIHDVIIDKMY